MGHLRHCPWDVGVAFIFSAGHTLLPTFTPIHSWTMPSCTLALETTGPSDQLGSGRGQSWPPAPRLGAYLELIRPTPMAIPEKSSLSACLEGPCGPRRVQRRREHRGV